jgi:GntR family phosphonate transport system transcriptional regulator
MELQQGETIWSQIARHIAADITAGRFPPGSKLPTEAEFAERFGVNRHTVRHALAGLENDGFIRAERGRGRFVQTVRLDYSVGARTRFTRNLAEAERVPEREILALERIRAEPRIIRRLDLAKNSHVWRLSALARADGVPLGLAEHHIDAARFPDFDRHFAEFNSITKSFAACGVQDYTRKTTRITARMPTAEEAARLELRQTIPLLVTEAVNIDREGRPLEVSSGQFAADRLQLTVDH